VGIAALARAYQVAPFEYQPFVFAFGPVMIDSSKTGILVISFAVTAFSIVNGFQGFLGALISFIIHIKIVYAFGQFIPVIFCCFG